MAFEIRNAVERARRRDARQGAALHAVWQHFMDHGGPVPLEAVEQSVATEPSVDVREAIKALDEADVVLLEDGVIQFAYPFTTGPNPFAVELPGGVIQYSCCAIDALGLAPMLGESIRVRSGCHHCGEPLTIDVSPDGPRSLPEVMVWVAPRDACVGRVASGL